MAKIKDLKAAEYNPRKISDKQLELLDKSMKEYGDLSGIVFNVATGQTLTSCLNLIRYKFVIPIVFIDNNI